MEFIQVAYCISVPLLLLLAWFCNKPYRYFFANTLAVSNLLLIGHSIFLIRQLIGFYQLVKQYGDLSKIDPDQPVDAYSIRMLLIILLPFFSLLAPVRKNIAFTLLMLVLLFLNNPIHTWNCFDLFEKIAVYLCLLCSGYALLWLLKQLPYQSRNT